jgi:hypothetical protein
VVPIDFRPQRPDHRLRQPSDIHQALQSGSICKIPLISQPIVGIILNYRIMLRFSRPLCKVICEVQRFILDITFVPFNSRFDNKRGIFYAALTAWL